MLVFWNLSTGQKSFLPRLQSSITHISISANDRLISVFTQQNSIRIFDFTRLKQTTVIQGLKSHIGTSIGLFNEQKSEERGKVITRGERGSIQWWDMEDEKLTNEVVVVEKGNRGGAREERESGGEISQLGFGNGNKWMGVVCVWNNFGLMKELQLRFYYNRNHNNNNQSNNTNKATTRGRKKKELDGGYELHTVVHNAHDQDITDLQFHPTLDICATCSEDKTFKIWEKHNDQVEKITLSVDQDSININSNNSENSKSNHKGKKRKQGEREGDNITSYKERTSRWECRSVGKYRDQKALALTFNSDGSMIGVAYDNVITVWNTFTNELVANLLSGYKYCSIRSLNFLTGTDFIVATTKSTYKSIANGNKKAKPAEKENKIVVWNVKKKEAEWIMKGSVKDIACDKIKGRFVVCMDDRYLVLMRPETSTPDRIWKMKETENNILGLTWISNPKQSTIVYLTNSLHLVKIEENLGTNTKDETNDDMEMDQDNTTKSWINNPREGEHQSKGKMSILQQIYGRSFMENSMIEQSKEKKERELRKKDRNQVVIETRIEASNLEKGKKVFAEQSHAIPALNRMYEDFMKTLMIGGKQENEQDSEEEEEEKEKQVKYEYNVVQIGAPEKIDRVWKREPMVLQKEPNQDMEIGGRSLSADGGAGISFSVAALF